MRFELEFLFECSTCYLVSESSERGKYRAREYKSVNTIGLYWEEKSSFLKYEIIGFTIRKKSRIYSVSAIRLKMKKMRWTITETDNGRSFLFTKFSVIDFFLTDKRNIFMYTAEIGLWQIFQLSIFVLSHEKYHYPGQGPNLRFFFSYFVLRPLPGNFEWHCLLEIQIFVFS